VVTSVVSNEIMVMCTDGRQLQALTTSDSVSSTVVLHMGTPAGLVPLRSQLVGGSRCRIVTYARPGYGKSTPRPGRTVADAASDTATILDALGIESFVTVGWSGGSPHALACAALLPDRCRATASVAGFAPIDAGVEDWSGTKTDLAWRGHDEEFAATLEAARAVAVAARAEDMPSMFPSAPDQAVLTGDFAEWLAAVVRSGYVSGVNGAGDDWRAFASDWGFELRDAHHVAIWHGDGDDVVDPACAYWLAGQIPSALLRILPDEGHVSIGLELPSIIDDLLIRAGWIESTGEPHTGGHPT
jgi:pimeloyl-ACP methyl ester carboxylesterase